MTEPHLPATVSVVAGTIDVSLANFEGALLNRISRSGLPTAEVFVPVAQRAAVFDNVETTLDLLTPEQRGRSLYMSKFLAAAAAGLFDAALNYLWDETVSELRRRIALYDLNYFYDLAVGTASDRRKQLTSAEDLPKVQDIELIQAANRMGLISDVGYQQLDLVRFMRNHASAAHPNQAQLRAMQLMNYLETCIVEVMNLPENDMVVEIKKLLTNIKSGKVEQADIGVIARTFEMLPADQIVNLSNGLFGIYTRLETDEQTRDNIRRLLPVLWPHLSEESRRQYGVRAARFTINQDRVQAELARQLLDAVDGARYLPSEMFAAEIDAALEVLTTAHNGYNNFYTEPAPAYALQRLIGKPEAVPEAVSGQFVASLVYIFLTNGNGVAWNADEIYVQLLSQFTPAQARVALVSFTDPATALRLYGDLPRKKFVELLDLIEPKLIGRPALDLVAALRAFTGRMDQARADTGIKRLLEQLGL